MKTNERLLRLGEDVKSSGLTTLAVINGAWRLPGRRALMTVERRTLVEGSPERAEEPGLVVLDSADRSALLAALGAHRPEGSPSILAEFGIHLSVPDPEKLWPLGLRDTGAKVLGRVEQSETGNSILRFGDWINSGPPTRHWTQTHHVVLSSSERETLITRLTSPITPQEELEAAAALLREQAAHLEAVARTWPAHEPHTSTAAAVEERRYARAAAHEVLYKGLEDDEDAYTPLKG